LIEDAYYPREDSLFLLSLLQGLRVGRVAEVGVGSGFVLANYLREHTPELVLATDIDEVALSVARRRLVECEVEFIHCSGCDPLRKESLSLIFFNPPYLRSDGLNDSAISGGEKGIEATIRLIQSCKDPLKRDGLIVFISSSLSDWAGLLNELDRAGVEVQLKALKRLFFETLYGMLARRH
jgi:release factor glutamine methyltransferase